MAVRARLRRIAGQVQPVEVEQCPSCGFASSCARSYSVAVQTAALAERQRLSQPNFTPSKQKSNFRSTVASPGTSTTR